MTCSHCGAPVEKALASCRYCGTEYSAQRARPRLTRAEREQLRKDARARYKAGDVLTFDEFVAKHENGAARGRGGIGLG